MLKRKNMELRTYQTEISDKAADLLNKYKIAYLSMDVRTGKTITSLEACRKYGAKKVLFVTKKKAIGSIQADAKHFPTLAVDVINYESISRMAGNDYDIVCVDEAHSLGAYPKPAKRVKDIMNFTRNKPIIFLSGTPAPESHSQLYHQFYISSFSPFKDYRNFYGWAKSFVNVGKKYLYNREINDYSNAMIDEIKKRIEHLMLSFSQSDAGFEVKLIEKIIYTPMSEIQKTIIERLLKDNIVTGKSGAVILADTAVKLQSKIHQVCSGTVLDEDSKYIVLNTNKAEKIKAEFAGRRIAIYYKFRGELDVLKKTFGNEYTELPDDFQNGTKRVFLSQFVSGREGIRLDFADAIIFYNIDFSYLSYHQAKNRIISKDRTEPAFLFWMFSEGGIEQKIYKAVTNKKDYTNHFFKKDYGVKISSKENQTT